MILSLVRKYRLFWLMLSGFLLGLTLVVSYTSIFEWIVIVPALAVMLDVCSDKNIRYRRLYGYGLAMFEIFYLVIFHWFFYMYPLDFTGMSRFASAVVVVVAWIGLATFQALGAAFILPMVALVVRGKTALKYTFVHPFIIAAVWTTFEWLQANSGWTGVPWGRLPLGQASMSIMLQSSSLFGSYFVTFLLVSVNGILAYLLLHPDRRKLAGIIAGSLFASNLAIGSICFLTNRDEGEHVIVAAVQGNLSSHEKWAEDGYDRAKRVYEKYSLAAAERGADIIIWPETALPYNIDRNEDLHDFVTDLAQRCNATLLVSVFTESEDRDPNKLYNSVIAIEPDGSICETVYSKRNLVPFGEFVPWRDLITTLIPPLADLGMIEEDLLVGDSSYVFDLAVANIGSLICFDSIYEANGLESIANGAQFIAVSTNDSWFRDSSAVYMHNSQSRLRAIETGRYVVRAANTGVSSIITSKGEVTELLGPLVPGYVMGEVYLSDDITLYSRIGNLFAYTCIALVGAFLLARPIMYCVNKKQRRVE